MIAVMRGEREDETNAESTMKTETHQTALMKSGETAESFETLNPTNDFRETLRKEQ